MTNIPFLKFQTNESVYSILARAHCILGHDNPLQTLTAITGIRGFKPMSGLPTHLADIAGNLKIEKSLSDIIDQNTHYPLYKYFLRPSRRPAVLDAMCGAGAVKSRIGLLRNHLGAVESLRFCEACLTQDFERNGFAYWHREHSPSWMYFCPHHNFLLKSISYEQKDYSDRALMLPTSGSPIRLPESAFTHAKLTQIVEDTMYLFNKNNEVDTSIEFENYRRLLNESGICSSEGRVNQRQVLLAVSSWLKDLNKVSGFERLFQSLQMERSWAAVICSKKGGFHHPLKHIVFLRSLGLSIEELFQTHGSQQQSFEFQKIKKSKPTDEQIIAVIQNSRSLREAARRLKLDVTTLCCDANRLKIPYTHRTKVITEDVIRSVIAFVKTGCPSSVVAKELGVSIPTVNRIKRSRLS